MRAISRLIAAVLVAMSMALGPATALGNDAPPRGRLIDGAKIARADQTALVAAQDEEIKILRGAGLRAVRAPGLVAYVNSVIDRLFAKAPVPHLPMRVVIEAEDEPNAACAPNGTLKVTLGLLRAVRNEDELAFILAHEISHVLLRHHDSNWGDKARQELMRGAVIAADAMRIAGSVRGTAPPQSLDKAIMAYTGVDLAAGVAVASFTREQEDDADLLGVDLMIAAGYNAAGATQAIARLPEFELRAPPAAGPTPDQRAAQALAQGGVGNFLGAMMQSMGDAVRSGIAQVQAETARKHRSHEERQSYVAEYLAREYPRRARPPLGADRLRAALAEPAAKAVLAQHEAAWSAMAKLNARDLKGAESAAANAIRNGGDRQVEPALTAARVRLTRGDRAGALRVLDGVAKAGEPALPVATARAWVHENQGKYAESIRILEEANREFGEPALVMPQLIRVYRRAGRGNDANMLVAKCRYTYPALAERCAAGA